MNITPAITKIYEYAPLITLRETNPILPALRSFSVGGSPPADSKAKKMLLRLTINDRRESFGYYADELEAAKEYDKAARKYHGQKFLIFSFAFAFFFDIRPLQVGRLERQRVSKLTRGRFFPAEQMNLCGLWRPVTLIQKENAFSFKFIFIIYQSLSKQPNWLSLAPKLLEKLRSCH